MTNKSLYTALMMTFVSVSFAQSEGAAKGGHRVLIRLSNDLPGRFTMWLDEDLELIDNRGSRISAGQAARVDREEAAPEQYDIPTGGYQSRNGFQARKSEAQTRQLTAPGSYQRGKLAGKTLAFDRKRALVRSVTTAINATRSVSGNHLDNRVATMSERLGLQASTEASTSRAKLFATMTLSQNRRQDRASGSPTVSGVMGFGTAGNYGKLGRWNLEGRLQQTGTRFSSMLTHTSRLDLAKLNIANTTRMVTAGPGETTATGTTQLSERFGNTSISAGVDYTLGDAHLIAGSSATLTTRLDRATNLSATVREAKLQDEAVQTLAVGVSRTKGDAAMKLDLTLDSRGQATVGLKLSF